MMGKCQILVTYCNKVYRLTQAPHRPSIAPNQVLLGYAGSVPIAGDITTL